MTELRPITLREANRWIIANHRHSGGVRGWRFGVALYDDDQIVGVGVAGRPVARRSDNGTTLEILRVCTDGTPNACSMIYGALRRAGVALGYRRIVTFTLMSEPGASLRAAGFRMDGTTPGRSWSVPSRPRIDKHETGERRRWIWEAS